MAGKIQTAVRDAVTNQKGKDLQSYLKMYQGAFAKALPKMITPERFTRMAMTALTTNDKLRNVTPESFIGACLYAAQLGLEPNTPLGQAYLIPFWNGKKSVLECQFQVGYKGLIRLAINSGMIRTIEARIVYENDEFEYTYGLNADLKHKPAKSGRGDMEYVYAVYHLVNGGYAFEVMSIDDVRAHAKQYSKSYNNGPWKTNFEEMAKKTVLKRLLKYAPLSTEVAEAADYDEKRLGGEYDSANDMIEIQPAIIVDEETGEVEEAESTVEQTEGGEQVVFDE